jgi:hypothetical protein
MGRRPRRKSAKAAPGGAGRPTMPPRSKPGPFRDSPQVPRGCGKDRRAARRENSTPRKSKSQTPSARPRELESAALYGREGAATRPRRGGDCSRARNGGGRHEEEEPTRSACETIRSRSTLREATPSFAEHRAEGRRRAASSTHGKRRGIAPRRGIGERGEPSPRASCRASGNSPRRRLRGYVGIGSRAQRRSRFGDSAQRGRPSWSNCSDQPGI